MAATDASDEQFNPGGPNPTGPGPQGFTLAFIADGKLFAKPPGQRPRPITSHFVEDMLDRQAADRQRRAWKEQSMAWSMQGDGPPPEMLAFFSQFQQANETTKTPVIFTALAPGEQPGTLIYALSTPYIGGLFHHELAADDERRLVHRQGFQVRDLDRHPVDGQLVCSLASPDGAAHLGLMRPDGGKLREITEGDSLDEAPSWARDRGSRILYQSAGIARDGQGAVADAAPYAIECLDLDHSELQRVHEEAGFDLLVPQINPQGDLLFLRRPHQSWRKRLERSPWQVMTDTVLFPVHLAVALYHYWNFFSMMWGGKRPATAQPARAKQPDPKRLLLWGRVFEISQEQKTADQTAPIVPQDWQLVRRDLHDREEVLAEHVLHYHALDDGGVLYTTGRAIHHLPPDAAQPTKLADADLIQRVLAV